MQNDRFKISDEVERFLASHQNRNTPNKNIPIPPVATVTPIQKPKEPLVHWDRIAQDSDVAGAVIAFIFMSILYTLVFAFAGGVIFILIAIYKAL